MQSDAVGENTGGDISVLDLLITLLENIRLLILGPLAMGFIALAASFALPQTFESVAVLRADLPWLAARDPAAAGASPAAMASLMTTAAVLDPVASSLGLVKNGDVEEGRLALQRQIKVAVGKQDRLLTLTVTAKDPVLAQKLAQAVLLEAFEQSRPKGVHLQRLQAQLAATKDRQDKAQGASVTLIAAMADPRQRVSYTAPDFTGAATSNRGEAARNYADILRVSAEAQVQIAQLETELAGLSSAQLVQPPTLPRQPVQPKKSLMAILASLATGMLLLVFVLVRQSLRAAAANATTAAKLARIRQLLVWLRL